MKRMKYIKSMKLCTLSLAAVLAFSGIVPIMAADTKVSAAEEETVTAAPYLLRTGQAEDDGSINVWLELDPVNAESVASYQIALQLQNIDGEAVSGRGMELQFDEALKEAEVTEAKFDETTQTMHIYVAGTQNFVQVESSADGAVHKLPIGTLKVEGLAEGEPCKVVVSGDDGDLIILGMDRQLVDVSEKYGDENGTFIIPSDGTLYGTLPLKIEVKESGTGTVKAYLMEEGKETPIQSGSKVRAGQQVRLEATPNTGYRLTALQLFVGDKEQRLDGSFTFSMTDAFTVKAAFEKVTHTITVGERGSISGKTGSSAEVASRTKVTVTTKAKTGEKFSHWINGDGAIVSYDATYSFIAVGDIELTPVFQEVPVEKSTTVSLDGVTILEFPENSGKYRMSYAGNNFLAEGCKIVERGIVLINKEVNEGNLKDFVIDGKIDGTKVAKMPVAGTQQQFIMNVNNVKPGQLRVGRAYLIYTDADGTKQTVYGDTWVAGTTPQ